ncbi:hypothetical protein [Bradyrhizobium sp. AS23.2]|uniref:hypothetical protein n=1 Tax=Bradyrhizobium sp. AS23.2 TaxID=1680155 RepID=UPI00093A003E|nr:hypothetical protein [Bradyrhizobium sp. AS23.2]OKO71892.1 hypothetical protein AC630_31755 [Bradyrhizobium sp. AS23.2]
MSKLPRRVADTKIARISSVGVGAELIRTLEQRGVMRPLIDECRSLDWLATAKYQSEAHLRECIATGEALRAEHAALFEQVEAAWATATIDDCRRELGILLLAFPGKSAADLSTFAHIALADVVDVRPTRLILCAACRRLRQTLKFQPALSELLAALSSQTNDSELRWIRHAGEHIAAVRDLVDMAHERLAIGDHY